jgi:hypothetical protein
VSITDIFAQLDPILWVLVAAVAEQAPADPGLYTMAGALYAQAADKARAERHPCAIYVGLALVHLTMAVKKALALGLH